MGRAGSDVVSRRKRDGTAAAVAGLGDARDAERARGLHAGVGAWTDAFNTRPDERQVLAPDGRGQEARVCGSLSLQRGPERRGGADGETAVEELRRVALRES